MGGAADTTAIGESGVPPWSRRRAIRVGWIAGEAP
jgi:hypothetical protein